MPLTTRLTARLSIEHPVVLAPMESVSGGLLASIVSRAGVFGLVLGGYGDYDWLARVYSLVGDARVGCGFICWALAEDPSPLHRALERLRPAAVMLSFGDPTPYAGAVRGSGAVLLVQVQTVADAERAIEAGADVIIAQGIEAGGHGSNNRSTVALVPVIADLVRDRSPNIPVVASGGIADGRGLAAALALGADGVLMGTRFWATAQALVPPQAHARMVEATGEHTVRSTVEDVVRGHDWPAPFTSRLFRNRFTDRWHGSEAELDDNLDAVRAGYRQALDQRDFDVATISGSQSAGLIRSVESADTVLAAVVAEAEAAIA